MLLSRFRGSSKNSFFFRLLEVVEVDLFDGQNDSRQKIKASTRVLIHGEFDSDRDVPPGPRGHGENYKKSLFFSLLKCGSCHFL